MLRTGSAREEIGERQFVMDAAAGRIRKASREPPAPGYRARMLALHLLACAAPADLVVQGGTVYLTADTTSTAVAVRDGAVIATGADAEKLAKKATEVVDLAGEVAVPGFHDAHTHLLAGSFVLDKVVMVGVGDMGTITNSVASYLAGDPQVPWVVGFGWVLALTEGPDGRLLDAVAPDVPVALFDSSGHALLVNSAGMRAAGIEASTPDPDGGEIVRDPKTGEPTGLFLEEAIHLVSPTLLAAFDDAAVGANLEQQIAEFTDWGVTTVSEILAVPGVDLGRPQIYADLEAAGALDLRVNWYLAALSLDDLARVDEVRAAYEGELVRFSGVKIWVDGSMGTGEGWSLEPQVGTTDNYGSHYFDPDELVAFVRAAEEGGYPMKMHANGDAAVQAALDALEAVEAERGGLSQPHTLEHAVLVDPPDLMRIGALGLTVSVQPTHALVADFGEHAESWGDGRFDRTYDFAGLVAAGVPVALGTDFPVWPSADGIATMWAATSGVGERAIPAVDALRAYTEGGAAAVGRVGELGCLDVGCAADLVLLDADPLSVDPADLPDVAVTGVFIAGRRVK